MPELRETYYTATDALKNIDQLTIDMLANTLAKVFRRWQHTIPHYHFTEEILRRICQQALARYEESNFDVEIVKMPETCAWQGDGEGNYRTACGQIFTLIVDTPEENEMAYCPFCGKKLEMIESELPAEPEAPAGRCITPS